MAGNEITLTIAGDASSATRSLGQAEQALQEVGQAAQTANRSIGSSEDAFETAARASGQLGESLDRASGGFSMLSGGIGDVGGALTAFTDMQGAAEAKALEMEAASIAAEEAQTAYNEAVAKYGAESIEARKAANDLAAAQAAAEPPSTIEEWGAKLELLSPIIMGIVGATDLMILSNTIAQASWVRTAASMVVARTAMIATSVATGVATAAQWLWNIAMTANPIGIIILLVAALVAGIVWVATQTTWFQTIWEYVWGAVTAYFEFAVNAWRKVFEVTWSAIVAYFNFVVGVYRAGWDLIVGAGKTAIGWFQSIPGLLKSAFSTVFSIITAPWRAAFNFISDAWNGTVGRLSWTIPSWVPGVGGNSISAPRLPKFHSGGRVPGAPGQEMLAILQAGEEVTPAGQSGGAKTVHVHTGGVRFLDALIEDLSGAIRAAGGDVQLVLGGG